MSSVRKWNYKSKVSHQSTNSFYIIFLSSSASSIYDQFMKLVKWVYTLFNLGALKYWEADISAILTETDRLNILPFQRPGCGNDVSYAVSIIRFKLFSSQSDVEINEDMWLYFMDVTEGVVWGLKKPSVGIFFGCSLWVYSVEVCLRGEAEHRHCRHCRLQRHQVKEFH